MTQDLLIITSPPASGKTYWIDQLAKVVGEKSLLIISPLRALADECKVKWDNRLVVMTPEEWCRSPVHHQIVIFDEFHLHFYWGDTFRPLMWEVFYELTGTSELTILLSATFSLEMQTQVVYFESQFDQMLWFDGGNQTLKYKPISYVKVPHRSWILHCLEQTPLSCEKVSVVFCAYRHETEKVGDWLRHQGFRVWTCVGGEAKKMQHLMQTEKAPHFIVCTTVLSHGVNLPEISNVYFLYPIQNIDFWIQMVARGGRSGNNYKVFGLEKPYGIKWSYWTNVLALLILGAKTYLRQYHQWFLKESSYIVFPIKKET